MSLEKCTCETCGKDYEIRRAEANRKRKLGSSFFCSLSCSGKKKRHNPAAKSEKNAEHLRKLSGNRADEFSPFRELLKRCKMRKKQCSLTLKDMKEQWEKQEGLCPYLKQPLVLPTTDYSHDTSNPNLLASVDRIDSSKGYEPGNIQFVSMTLNFAKNKFSEETLLDLMERVKHA